MSLTNPNKIVTEERLSDFYNRILPYLGGNDADSVPYDNTDSGLTSENVQDAIDELNESKASPLTNAEMTAIKNAFDTTNTSKFATTYTKYTTDELIVGEWIDGKPIYQKTINFGALPKNAVKEVTHGISNIDRVVNQIGTTERGDAVPSMSTGMWTTSTSVYIQTDWDGSNRVSCYVTLQYTKTTD